MCSHFGPCSYPTIFLYRASLIPSINILIPQATTFLDEFIRGIFKFVSTKRPHSMRSCTWVWVWMWLCVCVCIYVFYSLLSANLRYKSPFWYYCYFMVFNFVKRTHLIQKTFTFSRDVFLAPVHSFPHFQCSFLHFILWKVRQVESVTPQCARTKAKEEEEKKRSVFNSLNIHQRIILYLRYFVVLTDELKLVCGVPPQNLCAIRKLNFFLSLSHSNERNGGKKD